MGDRALWFIPSARNIPVFWDFVNRVDFVDKLIVQNYQWDTAMNLVRHFFFRQDYDYYIICSDDVIGYPDHLNRLIQDAEEHSYQVVSGWCNHLGPWASLSVDPINKEILNKSLEKPFPGLLLEDYKFLYLSEVAMGNHGYPFIKAWFNGGPLALLTRDALRKLPWRAWRYLKDPYCITLDAKRRGRPVMADVTFAIDCVEKGIPFMTDVRVFLYHIFGTRNLIRVGVGRPTASFVEAKNTKRTKAEVEEIQAILTEASNVAWKSVGEPIET